MKRFILILFTVCMTMFFLLPNKTQAASTSNYQKLVNYIETYGTSSGGYKTITHTSTYEDFAIQARSGYVLFTGNTVIGSGYLRIAYHMEFQLKESSNTVYISFQYQEGNGSIQSGSATVNRSTYVRGDEFYSGSSNFASFLNSEFRIICDHWNTHFINNLGFSLKGLGFSKFVGLSGDVCSHSYSNSCDTTCNICGATRTITHTYSNACDSSCNICGYVRTVSHTYSGSCDSSCNVCGYSRTTSSAHTYTNNCDTSCDICGYTRTVTHTYSNSCDTTCNSCGATRTVTHTYSGSCDSSCNICGYIRTASSSHTYSDSLDEQCNVCGETRITASSLKYSISGGKVSITGHEGSIKGDLIIPSTIEGYPVTTIESSSFRACTGLTSVTIPNGVTTIGEYAFDDCTVIKSVTIPDSVTTIGNSAFSGCISLKSVTIPDSVTTIGNSAFSYCSSLTSVTIPDSVTTIGNSAFGHCTGLTGIWVASNNSNYSSDSFGVLFNKKKTTLIRAPEAISEYTIPNSVTTIDYSAFSHCYSLTSVTIPDSVTFIDNYAFDWCTDLTSITIPDSVTTIGSCAFRCCRSLTSVTIGNSVTTIGGYAFPGCDSLNGIWVDPNNANYSSDSFGVLFNKNKTKIIQAPGAISVYTIPNGVTTIGEYAFDDCTSLKSVTIPDSVTTIESSSFRACTGLTSVTIPDSVTFIDNSAFSYCDSLKNAYYTGTANMWEEINILNGNDNLKNAAKHFEVKWIENCEALGWFCPECGKVVENLLENPGSCTYSSDCDEYCDVCDFHRDPGEEHSFGADDLCTVCGELRWLKGDYDGNEVIDNKDVEYLLWHTLFPESYPLPGNGDLTGDGSVDNKDVEYLLWHTLFPESYPLTAISNKKKEW